MLSTQMRCRDVSWRLRLLRKMLSSCQNMMATTLQTVLKPVDRGRVMGLHFQGRNLIPSAIFGNFFICLYFCSIMSSRKECMCGSLASIRGSMLTTSVCYTIQTLMATELMLVTCEESYHTTTLSPHHSAVSADAEVHLI